MFRSIGLALACLSLSACAAVPGPVPGPVPSLQATALDEKALYAAEALYNVPAQAYVIADSQGTLTADQKAIFRPLLIKAYDALLAVRLAYKAGNAADFDSKVKALRSITALIPK